MTSRVLALLCGVAACLPTRSGFSVQVQAVSRTTLQDGEETEIRWSSSADGTGFVSLVATGLQNRVILRGAVRATEPNSLIVTAQQLAEGENLVRIRVLGANGAATADVPVTRAPSTCPIGSLSYPTAPALDVGLPMGNLLPILGGGAYHAFAASPALPAGVSIDPNNGVISGTPTEALPSSTYIVRAQHACGEVSAEVKLEVRSTCVQMSVQKPKLSSLIYGDHDRLARTLTFSHDGSAATCSHDGVSFTECDTSTGNGGTLVFTPEDYTLGRTLHVRVEKAGCSPFDYAYTPLDETVLSREFVPCGSDERFLVHANESLIRFAHRLRQAPPVEPDPELSSYWSFDTEQDMATGRVVCIDAGVEIAHDGPGIASISILGATGVTIIGTETNRPLLRHDGSAADDSLFTQGGGSAGFRLANLRIERSSAGHALRLFDADATTLSNMSVVGSTFSNNIRSGGLTIFGSSIEGTVLISSYSSSVSANAPVHIFADEASTSTLRGTGILVHHTGFVDVTIERTRIEGLAPPSGADAVLYLNRRTTTLRNVDLSAHNRPPLVLDASWFPGGEQNEGTANVLIEDSVVRLTGSNAAAVAALRVLDFVAPTGSLPRAHSLTVRRSRIQSSQAGLDVDVDAGFANSVTLDDNVFEATPGSPDGAVLTRTNGAATLDSAAPNRRCASGARSYTSWRSPADGWLGTFSETTQLGDGETACP